MADSHIQQSIEWLDWYNQQYGPPQKDPAAVARLIRAIADYLHWMKSVNYTPASSTPAPEAVGAVFGFCQKPPFALATTFYRQDP